MIQILIYVQQINKKDMKIFRIVKMIGFIVIGLIIISSCNKQIKYGTADWNSESFGNHRCVLKVNNSSDYVFAHMEWRRRDMEPKLKNLFVTWENDTIPIENVLRLNINREFGDIIFQPVKGNGIYYVYYMPNISSGGNYPRVNYPKPENIAEKEWISKNGLENLTELKNIPKAELIEIQSIDEHNSFYPMEVIATSSEIKSLVEENENKDFLLFPEDRKYPIRMVNDLPQKWIKEGVRSEFSGEAQKGEFYTFQIGLYSFKYDINNVEIQFSDLKSGSSLISKDQLNCFNMGGTDWTGELIKKTCSVKNEYVQAFWFGIDIPDNIKTGKYSGQLTIKADNLKEQSIGLKIRILNQKIEARGDDEPWRHSRMRWLDSKIAIDDKIVKPFIPVTVIEGNINCLGRQLIPGPDGLPQEIKSFFNQEVTNISEVGRDILESGIKFDLINTNNEKLEWQHSGLEITNQVEGSVSWKAESQSDGYTLKCEAIMEFDGFVGYKLTLSSDKDINVKDIRLEIPYEYDAAKYMMGLGFKGGYRQKNINWKWEVSKNQDGAWMGDVNAGMQTSFRDENYRRPLNTNFYQSKPLNMPDSWSNDGKGGIKIFENGKKSVILRAFSGERKILAGEELHFNFNLLITPFKKINTQDHWKNRYYHSFKPVEEIAETGATVINVHHANEINPFINYPFLRPEKMKEYIDKAHERDMKVKIYYTVRELSNRSPELFALRSLGNEILSYGPGGGFSWLQEHLGGNYIAAWFVPKLQDAAIINSGVSRWHNYYLEGLDWLSRNIGIDGLYIDDVAFDRTIMKRVRKIIDKNREEPLIDLHSANQFNPRDGFVNSAHLYLEHFPYINRLWFGEYFDYDSKPDFWLIECSGIPFGLMGEMLQGGGNKWRGMVYGMTARLPWAGDPGPIWKVWDDFGIEDSKMIGYWSDNCPVRTDFNDVAITVYVKEKKVLISIGSWADKDVNIRLKFDWNKLGLNSSETKLYAPEILDFQKVEEYDPDDRILIPVGQGKLLILSSTN